VPRRNTAIQKSMPDADPTGCPSGSRFAVGGSGGTAATRRRSGDVSDEIAVPCLGVDVEDTLTLAEHTDV
jgi:hypothetical protein